jgi:hypothetical protein
MFLSTLKHQGVDDDDDYDDKQHDPDAHEKDNATIPVPNVWNSRMPESRKNVRDKENDKLTLLLQSLKSFDSTNALNKLTDYMNVLAFFFYLPNRLIC